MSTRDFVKVAKKSEIPAGKMITVEVDGESVLVANVKGKCLAIGAICKHEEWDLSEGTLEGNKVTCAGHGAVWDLTTGKAEFDEPLEDEPVYDVKIDENDILVSRRPKQK